MDVEAFWSTDSILLMFGILKEEGGNSVKNYKSLS